MRPSAKLILARWHKGKDVVPASKRQLRMICYFLALSAASSAASANPSFDCGRATTPDEHAICQSPNLSELDRILAQGFSHLRRGEQGEKALSVARGALRERRACQENHDCIAAVQLRAINEFVRLGAPAELPAWTQEQSAPPVRSPPLSEPNVELVSTGTGIVVSWDGTILTNAHVVDGCAQISVKPLRGDPIQVRVTASSPGIDLALLEGSANPVGVAAFQTRLRQGDDIYVYGFPHFGVLASSGNLVRGTVTALAGLADNIDHFQMSAPVQPGNSGGPAVSSSGHVVGVVVSKLGWKFALMTDDLPQNLNFAIKSSSAVNFLDANAVSYEWGSIDEELPGADVAEKAKGFTVLVSCYR